MKWNEGIELEENTTHGVCNLIDRLVVRLHTNVKMDRKEWNDFVVILTLASERLKLNGYVPTWGRYTPSLKPCPLCGSEANIIKTICENGDGVSSEEYQIYCSNQGCPIETTTEYDKLNLIAQWNNRPAKIEATMKNDHLTWEKIS